MAKLKPLDPCQKPPESIKAIYKYFQKLSIHAIHEDFKLLDFQRGLNSEQGKKCREVDKILGQNVEAACFCFRYLRKQELGPCSDVPVFEHSDAPGEATYLIDAGQPNLRA